MFKKYLSLVLTALLMHMIGFAVPAVAGTRAEKEAARIEKVKARVALIGVGPEARIKVKLHDNTKLQGYVSEASDDSFVVTDSKGTATTVAYPQVKQIGGGKFAAGEKIFIGAAIGAAAAGIAAILVTQKGGTVLQPLPFK